MIKFFKLNSQGDYKTITPQSLWGSDYDLYGLDRDDGSISQYHAYTSVARIYRAINIRAYRVASVPFDLYNGTTEIEQETDLYITWQQRVRKWFHHIEACLCIYGQAYIIIERNQFRRNPTPRLANPTTMTVNYDARGEIANFTRTTQYQSLTLSPEDVIHIWYPSLQYENYPGASPLQVVLGEAASVRNLTRFAQMYFQNGALLPTLFFFGQGSGGLPNTISNQELDSFLMRMKRLVGGIRNAWKFDAMRGDVTSHQIGVPPKDIAAPELSQIMLDAIAEVFGVPDSLLRSQSATYASADADILNFLIQTILPELETIILPAFNRLLALSGLHMKIARNRIEELQSYQLQQAISVNQIVDKIITVNEARAIIGMPPIEGGDTMTPQTPSQDNVMSEPDIEAMRAWKMAHDAAWEGY